MKILITRSNPIEPDSRVEKEAASLVKAGHEVILFAWDRTKNYSYKKDYKIISGFKIERISVGAKAGFGEGKKSLLPFIKFQIYLFFWILFNKNKFDIAHLCDFDTAFTGSKACFLIKKKYIFDIFDYLSTNAHSLTQKTIEKWENNIINKSHATIICTEQRKSQIQKAHPRKLIILHNSPNNIFLPNPIKSTHNKVKIAYVGILQDYRLIEEILNCISKRNDVELHIAGFGKLEPLVENAAKNHKNIIYYGKLQYDETLALENKCDILTAIYDPAIGNHKFAAPNKFYEGLFLGKPLIMVKKTGMSNYIIDFDIGVLIDYSADGFNTGLDQLIARKNEWPQMKIKMQNIYYKHFSWEIMEKRLLELYNSIEP